MISAPIPENDAERVETLRSYEILDTLPEREFDDLTAIAALICGTPISLITLIDQNRQWWKSKIGMEGIDGPRDDAFCGHVILQDDVLLVPDALKDERFHDHPAVIAGLTVRFYAGAPLIAPNGMRLGTLCVVDREPREIDATQIEALQRLARQVMSQMELRIKLREVEAARAAKAQFLANMSHEIRTPMNGIIGIAEVLMNSDLPDHHLKNLRVINTCGKTLMNLINDVLDYSKLEAQKIELVNEPFELRSLVEDVSALFTDQVSSKGIAFESKVDERCPKWVTLDGNRLSQILTNMLSNAVKFTETGRIAMTVESLGGQLRFSIQDTGIGISIETQKKLFRSFVQADASTTRKYGGSGLGLAISKSLCELMGGSIHLKSHPGLGSTFTCSVAFTAGFAPNEIGPRESVVPLHPLKVILAEDNHVNQTVGVTMLKKIGFQPVVARNGEEVLKLLEKDRFDLILMDRHMPIMDGVEATEEICRRYPIGQRPLIIAVTASALKEDEDLCLKAGMSDFLTKPVSLAKLEMTMKKWSAAILRSRRD